MNILLVYPKYPETFWSFKTTLKYLSKKATFPPLGLMTIAAMLPKRWKKKLVDTNIEDVTDSDLKWADMVFISAMLVQKNHAQEIIDRCKKHNKIVVAGGPAFTTQHEAFSNVDHFIQDEAEITLPLFLSDLENGTPKHIYSSTERPDIRKTPIPLWSLIKFKDYVTVPVQYSRGCPFNCEFCDIVIMNGRVPRTKSVPQMIAEFDSLYRAGWRGSVFIVDDNFIGNKSDVKKMLRRLIVWQKERSYPFVFLTEASINLAEDKELLSLMSRANFNKVFLGIETPEIDSLKECGKYQNMTVDLEEAVNTIHEHGIQVMGGFIVGFDSDTEKIFDSQIKFIKKIGVVTAMVGVLTALPKTRLWDRLKVEGRLIEDASGENTDGSINFVPKMGKENLSKGYKKMISVLYSRKEYYQRISIFLKHYKPTVKGKLRKQDIEAFIKSIWKIGVMSKARRYYWLLVLRTGATNIKALPIAVELAIIGQHFEKVAKQL